MAEAILRFAREYGLGIAIIALAGIAILGVMKYCNLFKGIEEGHRHYLYLAISVSISIIATLIYLGIVHQFTPEYIITVATAIFALNQTAYNIFKVTPVNDVCTGILDILKEWCQKIFNKDKTPKE